MSVIPFEQSITDRVQAFMDALPEIETLSGEEMNNLREKIADLIAALDKNEPKNENSEAYDLWAEMHEDLEDVLDEILDALES